MSIQSMQISLPHVNDRHTTGFQSSHAPLSARAMRRSETALVDGMQAWVRSGHGLTMLIGTDHPGPAFTYDLPVLRATAPLMAMPHGLLTELLTNISKMADVRAVWRAAAHSLNLNLAHTSLADVSPDWNDRANPAGALLQLLNGLADTAPLIIHLEGLHRADAPSLNLLSDVASKLEHRPILFVGIYRVDQPYVGALNKMLELSTFVQVDLAPAWMDDVAVFLDAMFGRRVPLNTMIEVARSDDRMLLLGGVPLLEACRRAGRWTEGLTLSERVITTAQVHGADYVAAAARLTRGSILIGLGQWADAQAECDMVIKSPVCAHDRNLTATAVWGGYKASTMLNLPAGNLLDSLKRWRAYARSSDDPTVVAPILADLVVQLVQSNHLHEARAWLSDLEALLDHSNHPATRLAVALGQGALAARQQDWRMASGAYRAAIDHAAQQHDLLLEARASSGLAFALLEVGDAESKNEGRERLSVAHSVLSRLNARPDVEACEAGAKQFGLRPRQRRPTASNRTPGALTRREREVLALIVNGMTNRQIAQRLTISEKTAEGHVGNILAKLSCSSRVKAAELARATGLLEGGAA